MLAVRQTYLVKLTMTVERLIFNRVLIAVLMHLFCDDLMLPTLRDVASFRP